MESEIRLLFASCCFAVVATVYSAEPGQNRFVEKMSLDSGRVAVVAEGEFEPRSIGSYSVRLYGPSENGIPTDFFVAGIIRPRDGVVEKVVSRDIDKDGQDELIVICRCVGTGSFLSADAFSFRVKELKLVASVSDIKRDADPLDALGKALQAHRAVQKL